MFVNELGYVRANLDVILLIEYFTMTDTKMRTNHLLGSTDRHFGRHFNSTTRSYMYALLTEKQFWCRFCGVNVSKNLEISVQSNH